MKNNKGITLIALVITIIVLLILAGVSIAMLTGENGILTQAENSKNDTSDAEVADRINMALNGEFTNLLVDGYFSGGSSTKLGDEATILSANGLNGTGVTYTPSFGTNKTDTNFVLKISAPKPSNTSETIEGLIKYVAKSGTEEAHYEIDSADYPQ